MVKFNLDLNGKTILVTGAAGFIGSNLAKRLINDYKDIKVIGLDTMTDYYDVNIKKERLRGIEALGGNWSFVEESIANKEVIDKIFTKNRISVVVNLAAQAGVRYSITNPDAYIQSNLIGFYNILPTVITKALLRLCRRKAVLLTHQKMQQQRQLPQQLLLR